MKSKLITIGDEILIGQIINTNASYIGEKLFSVGIPLEKSVVIGDEENILMNELEDSMKNFNVTLITGGLGPTHDDLTKTVLQKYFNDELILNEDVLAHVKNIFNSRNLPMPEVNINQAMVLKNSEVLWNELGTAPGILINKEGRIFAAMPGVPYEMKSMMEKTILPLLSKLNKEKIGKVLNYRTLLTTGLGESSLYEKLGDISQITGDSKLAFLPSAEGVRLRINAIGESQENTEDALEEIERKIRSKVGDYVYGTGDDRIEKIIGEMLRGKNKTLSVAESCTGGSISSKIVSIPGSSDYYLGGICSYSNEIKKSLLGVKEDTLIKHGAVSEQTAVEMAEGVRKLMNSDYAVSTTGIAGPEGGSDEKPVGLVWIGYSDKNNSEAWKFNFGSNREINIRRASMRALEILRRKLLGMKVYF